MKLEKWLKKKARKSNFFLGLYLICMGIYGAGYVIAAVMPLAAIWAIGYAMGGAGC